MLVKFAFSGIKGSWFLHLDVEPTTSIVKSPTETTEVIMENNRQPDEQNVLQANGNVSILVVTGEDRNQEIVANGITVEDGHQSETLGDTTFQKPSAQGDSLLPNVSSPQKQSLHVFSHGKLYQMVKVFMVGYLSIDKVILMVSLFCFDQNLTKGLILVYQRWS